MGGFLKGTTPIAIRGKSMVKALRKQKKNQKKGCLVCNIYNKLSNKTLRGFDFVKNLVPILIVVEAIEKIIWLKDLMK